MHAMSKELLDSIADVAFAKLKGVGEDAQRLSDPAQTIVVVYAVQGVMDNGGLRYFFENDWPGNPQYSFFADAYRRIGATSEAGAILAATALFDRPDPHLDAEYRIAVMDDDFVRRLADLERRCRSDVWSLLTSYAVDCRGDL